MKFSENTIINDRFRLIRQIGRGSFGEVWLAEDNILNIQVAVKIYIALDSKGLEEFKNEFKNVRHLNHPNLLRPDYYDHSENNPYLVMTYCPETVGDKVGKMSEQDVWALIKDVSAGLEYLHKMDIVHRDIKPDNILRNDQDVYVISDFGLSQKMRSTLRKASARSNNNKDSMSGTVGYMAPEMFSAKPNAVKATDIWALGATIYEVITGEMPFCGQGGVMELHGAELPDLPSNYGTTLSNLMHRCLSKDPWDRPTAREINEIAHSVCPDDNENIRAGISNKAEDQYLKEIDRLQKQLSDAKSSFGITDCGKIAKRKKIFKRLFWTTFCVWLITIVFGFWVIGSLVNEYEHELWISNDRFNDASRVILDIESICQNGTSSDSSSFPSWTSSNHTHNSRDYKEYDFTGYEGDELRFDYKVDSESYDHFKAIIKHNGSEKTLKDISGLNKNGAVSYKLPANGTYSLLVEFKKDHSVHSGRDNAQVYNVEIKRSAIGAISREIHEYKNSQSINDGDVVETVEEVVVAEEWDEDTVAVAEEVPAAE